MKIETNDSGFWLGVVVCITVVILGIITGTSICNAYPFSKGYVQQQQEGSQATLWTKPSK